MSSGRIQGMELGLGLEQGWAVLAAAPNSVTPQIRVKVPQRVQGKWP